MRKWVIIAWILVAVGCGGWIISKAAIPIITERHLMLVDSAFDGEAETYRELCGFAVGRWQSRQWPACSPEESRAAIPQAGTCEGRRATGVPTLIGYKFQWTPKSSRS